MSLAVGEATTVEVTVGAVDDIPLGEGRAFDAAGYQVAVFRLRSGEFRALQAVCPHRGGPIADGQSDARVVICPLHLYAWDSTTGASTAAPGSGPGPVKVYPVTVVEGLVVVAVPAERAVGGR